VPTQVEYAQNGAVNIAYQVIGDGPAEILMVPGWYTHLLLEWDEPSYVRFLERIASFARLVRFDKRGTGLSDRPAGVGTLEERMDDAHAVMAASSLKRPVLFGWSEGGPMAILFAATHPEQIRALVLYGTQARFGWAPDYPWRTKRDEFEAFLPGLEAAWGREVQTWMAPRADERYRAWLLRYQQASVSPAGAVAISRANYEIDVREILSTITVPTLVLSRRDEPIGPAVVGRYLADRIPGSRFVELEGDEHVPWRGDTEALAAEVEAFVTGTTLQLRTDRVLATILITDIARSTQHLVAIGDSDWRDMVATFQQVARTQLERFNGREIDMVGDQFMASFEGPVRAIRCAQAIQEEAAVIGLALRSGVHTGEVERAGQALRGIAVHIAARVAGQANAQETLVTETVRDITAGAGLVFADRGLHELKGIQGSRRLFAVTT
jgi:pimeloyl-ACP methyl ester carboxylesterase